MQIDNLTNIFAMIFSFIGILILLYVSLKIGGTIGMMIKFIVAGIFFSVFLHAGVELAGVFGFLTENVLLIIMGVLLSLGSILFIIGGYIVLKTLK